MNHILRAYVKKKKHVRRTTYVREDHICARRTTRATADFHCGLPRINYCFITECIVKVEADSICDIRALCRNLTSDPHFFSDGS
eukprot:SAG31_NODE_44_length_31168_cov_16.507290_24_plen_84_part_00